MGFASADLNSITGGAVADADATPEGVALYATAGTSKHQMADMPPNHRVEFFLGLNPSRDDIASHLAALAFYALEEQVRVGHGHTVPAGGPLWPGTETSSFLVLKPVQEIIAPIHLEGGMHVEFLQAIPVYASEVEFEAQRSAEDLIEHWRQSHVAFWNPERLAEPARH
jgi:hypothetical protein